MTNQTVLRIGALLAIGLLLTACTGREGAARDKFEQSFMCPTTRITSAKIESMTLPELEQRISPNKASVPPAEIKNDPARLTIWQNQQDEYVRSKRVFDTRFDTRFDLYRVFGCGHEIVYACQFSMPERGFWGGRCKDAPAGALEILRGEQ